MFSEANKEIEYRSTSPDITEEVREPNLSTMNSLQEEIDADRCKLN